MIWKGWIVSIYIFILQLLNATRLLPSDGSIIHCAGQTNMAAFNNSFIAYSTYLNNDTMPAVEMYYLTLNTTTQKMTNEFIKIGNKLETYPINQWVGIQIGLDFSGMVTAVANGEYDNIILSLINGIKSIGRPCYVRLGFEFNGQWNNYLPKSDYIASFQRITKYFRNNSWSNQYVANIWDFSADAKDLNFSSWYPGNEFVDWYGINIFSNNSAPNSNVVHDFINNSCNKGYPIIFGESTPRYTGVLNGNESWNEWFQPYFYELILEKEKYCVRQFCYIDGNWTGSKDFPNWGDAQIQDNDVVGQNYQKALYQGNYFHSSNKNDTLYRLGLLLN